MYNIYLTQEQSIMRLVILTNRNQHNRDIGFNYFLILLATYFSIKMEIKWFNLEIWTLKCYNLGDEISYESLLASLTFSDRKPGNLPEIKLYLHAKPLLAYKDINVNYKNKKEPWKQYRWLIKVSLPKK